MAAIICKKCDSNVCVKNGFIEGEQRYRCKECLYNFTLTPRRGKHPALKALAVLLYGSAGVPMSKIARLIKISEVAVYKWIRAAGLATERLRSQNPEIIMMDEMWHYVNGKKTKFGFGKPMILYGIKSLPGIWVAVMTEVSKNSSQK